LNTLFIYSCFKNYNYDPEKLFEFSFS